MDDKYQIAIIKMLYWIMILIVRRNAYSNESILESARVLLQELEIER